MKKIFFTIFTFCAVLFSCNIEKEKSGEMPEVEVDVETEAGEMPEYNVNWADVKVEKKVKTVEVPKVIITMVEKEVEVPSLKFNMPGNKEDYEKMTITVEADISGTMQEIEIEKVYALNNTLYVISELEAEGPELGDETVRISDQIEIEAPDDLVVKQYIIGENPGGSFNSNYRYIASEDDIRSKLEGATIIYED